MKAQRGGRNAFLQLAALTTAATLVLTMVSSPSIHSPHDSVSTLANTAPKAANRSLKTSLSPRLPGARSPTSDAPSRMSALEARTLDQSSLTQTKIIDIRSANARGRAFNAVSGTIYDFFLNPSSAEVYQHSRFQLRNDLQEKGIEDSSRKTTEQRLFRVRRNSGQNDEKYKNEFQKQAQTEPSENVTELIHILELCSNIFKNNYNGELPPEPVIHYFSEDSKKFMRIFLHARFVNICLPLYRAFDNCKEMDHLTICTDLVVFIHSHNCQRPSDDDKYYEVLLLRTLVLKDYNCFQIICDGKYRVVVQNVSGITVQVWIHDHENPQCDDYYSNDEVIDFLAGKDREVIVWTINTFFPCCYSVYGAVWLGVPDDRGVNKFWDYLPYSCRVAESMLVFLVTFVGLSGTLGNLLVVVVVLISDDRGESCILRTSLAFADLFTSMFVIVPSIFDHLSPILEIYDLKENYQVIEYERKTRRLQLADFADVYETENSFRMFQGLVLSVCSFVSLFTLFMLSVERLILTGRAIRYQHYFSVPRIKAVIMITWFIAVLNTLTFMYNGEGGFTATWSNILKLPLAMSLRYSEALIVNLVFLIQVALLTILCFATLILSIVSIARFGQEQSKVAAEWKNRNMRVSGPFSQENRYILGTMFIMTLLYMVSVIPRAAKLIVNNVDHQIGNVHLMEYFSWWLFVAGSAWNPWIYNMRSQRFKKDARNLLQSMIPQRLKDRLRRPSAQARRRRREEAQRRMLRSLGLADDYY